MLTREHCPSPSFSARWPFQDAGAIVAFAADSGDIAPGGDEYLVVDSEFLQRLATEVCYAIPAEMSNISRTEEINFDVPPDVNMNLARKEIISVAPVALGASSSSVARRGLVFRNHYDNCGHASCKQRAWLACPVRHHAACYRYMLVEKAENEAHLTAILVAWAFAALFGGAAFDKEAHKACQPSEDEVRRFWR